MSVNPCSQTTATGSGQTVNVYCGCGGSSGSSSGGGGGGGGFPTPTHPPTNPNPYPPPNGGGGGGSGPNGTPGAGDVVFYPPDGKCVQALKYGPRADGAIWDNVDIKALLIQAARAFVPATHQIISVIISVRASGYQGAVIYGVPLNDAPYLNIDERDIPGQIAALIGTNGGAQGKYFYADNMNVHIKGKPEVILNAKLPAPRADQWLPLGQTLPDDPSYLDIRVCSAVGNKAQCDNPLGQAPLSYKVGEDPGQTVFPGHEWHPSGEEGRPDAEFRFGTATAIHPDPTSDMAIFFPQPDQDNPKDYSVAVWGFNGGDNIAPSINLYKQGHLQDGAVEPKSRTITPAPRRGNWTTNVYEKLPEGCYIVEYTHAQTGSATVLIQLTIQRSL